jgi:hypothetical protein
MRKKNLGLLLVVFLSLFFLAACKSITESTKEPTSMVEPTETAQVTVNALKAGISDDFQEGVLSENQWRLTRQNDFRQSIVDVVDVHQGDYRLRLLADTIGTMDDTVKFHGIRSLRKIDFAEGKVISFDLDWNNQANGSYLTAGIYLCPAATDTNPRDEPDWIAVEYVGVPPGKNARLQVASMNRGNLRFLFTEGWPDKQRTGREITNQHLELFIDKNGLKVLENEKELFSTLDYRQDFTQAYLYLQMSSHSNYSSREVYFDNIAVQSASSGIERR